MQSKCNSSTELIKLALQSNRIMRQLHIFLFVTTFLIVMGCTIEKRLYQPGYRVEWRTKNIRNAAPKQELAVVEEKQAVNQIAQPSHNDIPANLSQSKLLTTDEMLIVEQSSINPLLSEPVTYNTPAADTVFITPVTQPHGIASLISVVAGIGCAIASVDFTFLLIVALLLVLAAIALGFISVIEFKKYRIYYTNNIAGVFGLVLSIAALLFALTVIILLIMLF